MGQSILEAAAQRVRVIASLYGGFVDYMDNSTMLAVECTPVRTLSTQYLGALFGGGVNAYTDDDAAADRDMEWCEPSVVDAAGALWRAYVERATDAQALQVALDSARRVVIDRIIANRALPQMSGLLDELDRMRRQGIASNALSPECRNAPLFYSDAVYEDFRKKMGNQVDFL